MLRTLPVSGGLQLKGRGGVGYVGLPSWRHHKAHGTDWDGGLGEAGLSFTVSRARPRGIHRRTDQTILPGHDDDIS